MLGLTRGFSTLVGVAVAGFLLWLASQLDERTTGGYWAAYGIAAAAGLTMALSQLLGGWTKWGWPKISANVLVLGFLPALVVGGWVILASQPDANWFRDHVQSWSADIGVRDVVFDLNDFLGALAFGIGLVFGFTFDTTGPRIRRIPEPAPAPVRSAVDEPTAAERTEVAAAREPAVEAAGTPVAPQPIPADERDPSVPSRE